MKPIVGDRSKPVSIGGNNAEFIRLRDRVRSIEQMFLPQKQIEEDGFIQLDRLLVQWGYITDIDNAEAFEFQIAFSDTPWHISAQIWNAAVIPYFASVTATGFTIQLKDDTGAFVNNQNGSFFVVGPA